MLLYVTDAYSWPIKLVLMSLGRDNRIILKAPSLVIKPNAYERDNGWEVVGHHIFKSSVLRDKKLTSLLEYFKI